MEFALSDSRSTPKVNLGDLTSSVKPWVKNLGVIFDDGLKFDKQINTVVKSCFFQLRLLAKVKHILSSKNFEKVIHAFITSRLDYCVCREFKVQLLGF